MRIRFIKAVDTHPLRHLVLRPDLPLEECALPNDRDPKSFHLGAYSGQDLIGIGSFFAERHPELKGWKQFRLRGMVTHPDRRGQGVGTRLFDFAIDHLRSANADLLWCTVHIAAQGFYERRGFTVQDGPAGTGKLLLMVRRL